MKKFPFINLLHQETRKPTGVPLDDSLWPESWKRVLFKEYVRMPTVQLPPPQSLDVPYTDVLKGRSSKRNFDASSSLTKECLSTLLFWSAGINRKNKTLEESSRFYPSGGARYPLEVYISLKGNSDIECGIYHYNVKNHSLEKIHSEEGYSSLLKLQSYPWAKDAEAFFIITGVFDRTMQKYKERGYRFPFIESGALLQNIYLTSEALQLGCCGLGVSIDDKVEEILDIDTEYESVISYCVVGNVIKENDQK